MNYVCEYSFNSSSKSTLLNTEVVFTLPCEAAAASGSVGHRGRVVVIILMLRNHIFVLGLHMSQLFKLEICEIAGL